MVLASVCWGQSDKEEDEDDKCNFNEIKFTYYDDEDCQFKNTNKTEDFESLWTND